MLHLVLFAVAIVYVVLHIVVFSV